MADVCDLCGEETRRYVILNRWAVVSGRAGSLISGPQPYKWIPKTGVCSGFVLCAPGCVGMWIEARLVEGDVRARGMYG